jgi:hypothetical protein
MVGDLNIAFNQEDVSYENLKDNYEQIRNNIQGTLGSLQMQLKAQL